MALVMTLCTLSVGTVTFGADSKTVDALIKGGAAYLLENADSFSIESSADFLMIIRSGVDVSKYKDGYVNSVKSTLQANSGKLAFTSTSWEEVDGSWVPTTTTVEDFCLTASAILCLRALGYNPESFYGYNLNSYFAGMDFSALNSNPYQYRFAIEVADGALAKKIIDSYIGNYYVMGSGLSYYGYSCDNTSNFLTAIAPYKNSYANYVSDAKKVIQSYTRSNGAYCDEVYSTEVNADSTATALMAYASIGDLANANKYYSWLVNGFSGSKTGVFTAYGSDNAYATKDALLALEYYKTALDEEARKAEEAKKAEEARKAAEAEKAAKEALMAALDSSKPKITKLTAGKKKIRIVYDKVENAAGYEIMYSTSKKFPAKKTKKITVAYGKSASRIFKGLKRKKKYYFKVRAYGIVDGKIIRGKWSAVKSKKTK